MSNSWISPKKRLAIYLRDGLRCIYCGSTIENGAKLSLDHLKCRSKNGNNNAGNLVTCCTECNSRRHNRPLTVWAGIIAAYCSTSPDKIFSDIRRLRSRSLRRYMKQAEIMIAERGTAAKALNTFNQSEAI